MPGHFEILIIVLVGVLIFGKQLPKIIGGITKSIKEFRKGVNDD